MKPARPKRTRLRTQSRPSNERPKLSKDNVLWLEEQLNYQFKDRKLLDQAMTHPGRLRGAPSILSNQRLEFLGDRVLGLVIAGILYNRYPEERESGLAPRLNKLVNRETCALIAREIGLPRLLMVDPSDERNNVREKTSVAADVIEAVIGAIYLDGGLSAAQQAIEQQWTPLLTVVAVRPRDPKSKLQEWAQARGLPAPSYALQSQSGPDHAPEFVISAELTTGEKAIGRGTSKQSAQTKAANELIKQLKVDRSDD